MDSILIIDDSSDWRETLEAVLQDQGLYVRTAAHPVEAFEILKTESFDLLICDLHLPFANDERIFDYIYNYEVGIKTIQELKWVFPDMQVLAISATVAWQLPQIMESIPDVPVLAKPFGSKELLDVIARLDLSQSNGLGLH